MSPRLREFLQRWVITTVAVLIAEWLVPGIHTTAWTGLLLATLILGVLNAVLRPLLVAGTVAMLAALNVIMGLRLALVTLPLQIMFFGFLVLAINATLLLAVSSVVTSFRVAGFWTAFWGGLVISVAMLVLNSMTGSGNARISIRRGRPPGRDDSSDSSGGPGNGPIIDV